MSTTTLPVRSKPATAKLSADLWNEALTALEQEDQTTLSNYGLSKPQEIRSIISSKLEDKETQQWKIKLRGKPVAVRDIFLNIIGVIDKSKDYVQSVASLEPHAAIAWTALSVALSLVINVKTQAESMLEGLEKAAYLLGLYSSWEQLYLDKCDDNSRIAVLKLYTCILHYQANVLHYLGKGSGIRLLRNAVARDDWSQMLADMQACDEDCIRYAGMMDVDNVRKQWDRQYTQLTTQSDRLLEIHTALKDLREQNLESLEQGRLENLWQALSTDYREVKDSHPKRVADTCEWFLQNKTFLQWQMSNDSCLLHVHAGPGCGKSVLSKALIDERLITTSGDAIVLYFFFKATVK